MSQAPEKYVGPVKIEMVEDHETHDINNNPDEVITISDSDDDGLDGLMDTVQSDNDEDFSKAQQLDDCSPDDDTGSFSEDDQTSRAGYSFKPTAAEPKVSKSTAETQTPAVQKIKVNQRGTQTITDVGRKRARDKAVQALPAKTRCQEVQTDDLNFLQKKASQDAQTETMDTSFTSTAVNTDTMSKSVAETQTEPTPASSKLTQETQTDHSSSALSRPTTSAVSLPSLNFVACKVDVRLVKKN